MYSFLSLAAVAYSMNAHSNLLCYFRRKTRIKIGMYTHVYAVLRCIREGHHHWVCVHSDENRAQLMLYKYGDYLCRHIYTVPSNVRYRQRAKQQQQHQQIKSERNDSNSNEFISLSTAKFIPLVHLPRSDIPWISQTLGVHSFFFHLKFHAICFILLALRSFFDSVLPFSATGP